MTGIARKMAFTGVYFVLFAFLPSSILFSQQKSIRQSSIEAFENGDYEKAYDQFRLLLLTYPRDPVYKYYCGVSLVKAGREPQEAQNLLKEALDGRSLKALPSDALFYLGRAQQMSGDYPEAEKSFRRFIEESGNKKARELNTQEYIQQCREGQGKLEIASPRLNRVAAENTMPTPGETEVDDEKHVTREFLPDSVDKEMTDLLDQQATTEDQSAEIEIVQKPSGEVSLAEGTDASFVRDDEINDNLPDNEPVMVPVNTNTVDPAPDIKVLPAKSPDQKGIFSIFEERSAYPEDDKIEINPGIPEGLVFRIQMAVFRNPVSSSYFKGFMPVEGFRADGSSVTVYYAGLFRRSDDARKALVSIRNKGFRDAFIASLMDGKSVSAERAAILEKEWGSRPLFAIETENTDEQLDTVPPTLHFRVEIKRVLKPLDNEEAEHIRKVAGDRGLDIRQIEDGSFVYLIGNFITFESAEDYADLLQRNGYRDAKVVAWLGRREIDLETAIQLFENLK